MLPRIVDYRLHRMRLPAGRVIGDWMCRYEAFTCIAVELKASNGLTGWGFAVRVSDGQFARPAPWRAAVCSLQELRIEFASQHWKAICGRAAEDACTEMQSGARSRDVLSTAARGALWDLKAKTAGVPLYQLLGSGRRASVRAYASPLEFHLDEPQIKTACRWANELAMSAIKVKVGHADAQRDVARLRLIQESMPSGTELAIDANTAWTAQQTLDWVTAFDKAGIELAYVEDPLPLDDVAGYERLRSELPVDVVGHDYVTDPQQLRPVLDVGGLQRLRVHSDVDFALKVASLADEYDLPMIVGNMIFETGVHVAAAFERVERVEFSKLAWNNLPQRPVRVDRGRMFVPQDAGAGQDPQPDVLELLSSPLAD